jgi:hypothetical protein
MAKNKTTENENSIADFLTSVSDETKRKDSLEIAKIFSAQTGSSQNVGIGDRALIPTNVTSTAFRST